MEMLPLGGATKLEEVMMHRGIKCHHRDPLTLTWAGRRFSTEVPSSLGNQAEAVLGDINPIRRPETTHSLAGPPEEAPEPK